MRVAIALLCIVLAGCVLPYAISPVADRSMASLRVNTQSADPLGWGHGSIWSVDGHNISKGLVQSIFVAPGRRSIGYSCPGVVYLDAAMPPTIEHVFEANESYEIIINCNTGTHIQMVKSGT